MKNIKHELRNIIYSNGSPSETDRIKKVQNFLRGYAQAGLKPEKQQRIKSEEATALIKFAETEGLLYTDEISEDQFISAGAEQYVYRFDDFFVLKTNASIFYEFWLDYFNSLLLHNYFFSATKYELLGFKIINDELSAVVKQEFVIATAPPNLSDVKKFLAFNGFEIVRNNDYINKNLGIIFEDLHDENVLCNNGILFFIDTVFYLTNDFHH
jgi:hypothetical protein